MEYLLKKKWNPQNAVRTFSSLTAAVYAFPIAIHGPSLGVKSLQQSMHW